MVVLVAASRWGGWCASAGDDPAPGRSTASRLADAVVGSSAVKAAVRERAAEDAAAVFSYSCTTLRRRQGRGPRADDRRDASSSTTTRWPGVGTSLSRRDRRVVGPRSLDTALVPRQGDEARVLVFVNQRTSGTTSTVRLLDLDRVVVTVTGGSGTGRSASSTPSEPIAGTGCGGRPDGRITRRGRGDDRPAHHRRRPHRAVLRLLRGLPRPPGRGGRLAAGARRPDHRDVPGEGDPRRRRLPHRQGPRPRRRAGRAGRHRRARRTSSTAPPPRSSTATSDVVVGLDDGTAVTRQGGADHRRHRQVQPAAAARRRRLGRAAAWSSSCPASRRTPARTWSSSAAGTAPSTGRSTSSRSRAR